MCQGARPQCPPLMRLGNARSYKNMCKSSGFSANGKMFHAFLYNTPFPVLFLGNILSRFFKEILLSKIV